MKQLLEKYLRIYFENEEIHIIYYNVEGATCETEFYLDKSEYYRDTKDINIWDMLVFLNTGTIS